jgi:hypothetical protein
MPKTPEPSTKKNVRGAESNGKKAPAGKNGANGNGHGKSTAKASVNPAKAVLKSQSASGVKTAKSAPASASKNGTKVISPELAKKEGELRELETKLNSREVGLIEREIKTLRVQEEVDRLRPLSGLYRVVKAMATERRLDSLLDVITRETQMMLKCDRCLDTAPSEFRLLVPVSSVSARALLK